MTKKPNRRDALAFQRTWCYPAPVNRHDEHPDKDDADFVLTPEQIRVMKRDQWSDAIEGIQVSDDDMLRWTKRFYATGRDKRFKVLLAQAKRERQPLDEILREHRKSHEPR